jgi:hypothetical protein
VYKPITLNKTQKTKVELEEKYRYEIRKQLEESKQLEQSKKPSFGKRIWEILNSSFGLWLLSAIFITGVGTLYTQYQNNKTEEAKKAEATKAEEAKKKELIERLDLEIGYRFSQVQIQLNSLVNTKDDNYTLLPGKSESDVRTIIDSMAQTSGGSIIPLYQEFSSLNLVALIAELRRNVPQSEKDEIDQVLAHLSGIYIHLNVEKVALSDVYGVAKIVFKDLILGRWKDSKFYFTDCAFC